MEVTVESRFDTIKVRIGGLLHLNILRSKLLGVQSWVWTEQLKYCVEFTFTEGVILTEYDDRERFEAILRGLDAVL